MKKNITYLVPDIQKYLSEFPVREDDIQKQMRAYAHKDRQSQCLISAEVGRFLYLITKLTGAKKIYEAGSYIGYSASWFLKALPDNGEITLVDNDPKRLNKLKEFFAMYNSPVKCNYKSCKIEDDLPNIDDTFDIIFMEHNKWEYTLVYNYAKQKVRRGGIILADNVLWQNRVVMKEYEDDKSTIGVLDYNKTIMNDSEVISMILPIGDGISISYKL